MNHHMYGQNGLITHTQQIILYSPTLEYLQSMQNITHIQLN